MAHIRESRPDTGLDFEVQVLTIFQVVSVLGSGLTLSTRIALASYITGVPRLSRKSPTLGPYGRTMPRALWWS